MLFLPILANDEKNSPTDWVNRPVRGLHYPDSRYNSNARRNRSFFKPEVKIRSNRKMMRRGG
jgi:hypothetical protein